MVNKQSKTSEQKGHKKVLRPALRPFAISTAFLTLLGLVACTPSPYGDHDLSEVHHIIQQSGLVYSARVGVPATSMPFTYEYDVMISLSAAASRPENLEDSVDFLLRTVWAQNETRPSDESGSITIVTSDGTAFYPCTIARERAKDPLFECGTLVDNMTELYGRWPGPLPELPASLKHLADTRCQDQEPGPHGTHTCGQIAQIATNAIMDEVTIKDMPNSDPEKTDLIIDTRWIEPEDLDYILRLSWSETSFEPTGNITLLLASYFGYDEENDLYIDVDYPFPCENVTPVGISGVAFDLTCMEQLYGPWPGPLPEPPAPATPAAPTSASPSPSPSS